MKRNNSRPDALLLGLAVVQVADVLAEENLATDRRVASGDEHDLSGRVVLDVRGAVGREVKRVCRAMELDARVEISRDTRALASPVHGDGDRSAAGEGPIL